MEHIRRHDWCSSKPDIHFVTERDLDNSVTQRILRNKFRNPMICSEDEDEPGRIQIDWKQFFKNHSSQQRGQNQRLFVAGLRTLPPFPRVSALNNGQHYSAIKILSTLNPHVLPTEFMGQVYARDHDNWQVIKEVYEKEQQEFIEWAKTMWTNNGHCIRALRPKPIIETVYEARYRMKAEEIAALPKHYDLAAHISYESREECKFKHVKDLVSVKVSDLPQIRYPQLTAGKVSILRPCPVPEPCNKHPVSFVLPNEKTKSILPLTEIHRELAQYALDNQCQYVASEAAVRCLVNADSQWTLPVTVTPALLPDGDKINVLVLGSEICLKKEFARTRSYRAYKHLLEYSLIPPLEKARMLERFDQQIDSEESRRLDGKVGDMSLNEVNNMNEVNNTAMETDDTSSDDEQPLVIALDHKSQNDDSDSDAEKSLQIVEDSDSESPTQQIVGNTTPNARKTSVTTRNTRNTSVTTPNASNSSITTPNASIFSNTSPDRRKSCFSTPNASISSNISPDRRKSCFSTPNTSNSKITSLNASNPSNISANASNPSNTSANASNPSNISANASNPSNTSANASNPSNTSANASNPSNTSANASNPSNTSANASNPSNTSANASNPSNTSANASNPSNTSANASNTICTRKKSREEIMNKEQAKNNTANETTAVKIIKSPVIALTRVDISKYIKPTETSINNTTKCKDRKSNVGKNTEHVRTGNREENNEKYNKIKRSLRSSDNFYECSCKDSLFKMPPPRSFQRWELKGTQTNIKYDILVHCSHKARDSSGEVILEPIPEYQIDLGGSKQSDDVIRALALSLALRKSASVVSARVDAQTGEVVTIDNIFPDQFTNRHGDRMSEISGTLHAAFTQLTGLLPGHYLLVHEAGHGSNALVYVSRATPGALTLQCDSALPTDEASGVRAPPTLACVLLPAHKFRKILPCAFTPFENQVVKEQKKAPVKQKPPPQALRWPKRKRRGKKSNSNRGTQ